MSKKLLALVLVLALTSMASALQWVGASGTQTAGAWENIANWAGGTRLPAATDTNAQLHRSDATGCNITISTAVSGSIKPQMKSGGPQYLTILNGGSMTSSGSFEQTQGITSLVTVNAGGALNVAQTSGSYKIASNGTSIDTLDIYGTVNVGNGTTLALMIGNAALGGTATVKVRNGGQLNVDAITWGGADDTLHIWAFGQVKIKGDVKAVVDGKIGTQIIGEGTTIGSYVAGGYTYIVPEPATIALLGLGSLLLRRKK